MNIYNYKDDEINKIFNFKDLIFDMIPKMPELLKNENTQKLFNINGQPTKLFIEFNTNLKNMANNSIGKSYSRSRYHLLVGNSKERRRAFHEIKDNLNYVELCNSIDYLEKNNF